MGITQWESHGIENKSSNWEWEGTGSKCMEIGGSGNVFAIISSRQQMYLSPSRTARRDCGTLVVMRFARVEKHFSAFTTSDTATCTKPLSYLSQVVSVMTQAQKDLGSNRSRDAVG